MTSQSFFCICEYLRENETICEHTLAYEVGAQMGKNHRKNRGNKSLDTVSLKYGATLK